MPAHKDPALKSAYLEAYAARDGRKRLSELNTSLRINQRTVDHWLRDPGFSEELERIDERRLGQALRVAATYLPDALEELGRMAVAPSSFKSLKDLTRDQLAVLRTSVMATRTLLEVLGVEKRKPSEVNQLAQDTFGQLPDTFEGLLEENMRLDAIFERAKEENPELVARIEAKWRGDPEPDSAEHEHLN